MCYAKRKKERCLCLTRRANILNTLWKTCAADAVLTQAIPVVTIAFIPNPDGLPQVNHKDEVKAHNIPSNLEWCTNDYNINYGTGLLRGIQKRINGKLSKAVLQFSLLGTKLAEFPSVDEAARNLGNINRQGNICACCNGSRETAYGYVWKYK